MWARYGLCDGPNGENPMPPASWSSPRLRSARRARSLLRWCVREWRRINAELDRIGCAAERVDRERLPKLRRDPRTGVIGRSERS